MPEVPPSAATATPLAAPVDLDGVTGTEWIVEAFDCDADRLRDLELVTELCDQVIGDLQLKVLGQPLRHSFPSPGGVTALYLLTESHFACHTYPEFCLATFNLYCCRARPEWDWRANLIGRLGAAEVQIQRIARGLPASTACEPRGRS